MPHFRRVLHGAAVAATMTAWGVVGVVGLVAYALTWPEENRAWTDWALLGLGVFWAIGCGVGIWKTIGFKLLLPCLAGGVAVLGWLAHDSPELPPIPESAPLGSKDSESYRVLMWMATKSPHSRVEERKTLIGNSDSLRLPADHAQKPDFVAEHAAEIAAWWEKDTIGRQWIGRLGGLSPGGVFKESSRGDFLSFQPSRSVFELHLMQATSLCSAGRYEEGLLLIEQALSALHNIQRGSALLVHQMICTVLLKRCAFAAEAILEMRSLEGAQTGKLATAFKAVVPVEVTIRQAFLGERWMAQDALGPLPASELKFLFPGFGTRSQQAICTRFFQFFLLNPKETERSYAAFLDEVCELAETCQLTELDELTEQVTDRAALWRWKIKNPTEDTVAALSAPAFPKIAANFWETDDHRLALLKRLETPLEKARTP